MRTVMRESAVNEQIRAKAKENLSERRMKSDELVERWSKRKGIGEGLIEAFDKNPTRIRNLAFVLESQERHLKSLTETQISNAFQTTPENVMKVVRFGYPNSVRGDVFLEWAMDTARDSIYYLYPVYAASKRGATAAGVTLESSAFRFASEEEEEVAAGTINGSNKVFTGASTNAVTNPPIRPWSVKIYLDNKQVAADNGIGGFTGAALTAGTIDYTTGALSVTFDVAPPSGSVVSYGYNFDSEVSSQYADIGEIELQLRDYQFRVKPMPLGFSWSKMTELLIGTTLDIDAEEALIRGAGEELKKALDFQALSLGYRGSLANTAITFDADFASAGADNEIDHAQSITKAIDRASDAIFDSLQRGGVTKIYGGPNAISYLKLHSRFSDAGRQPVIGAHKVGSLDGIDLFKVPSAIVPNDELVCVYRNEQNPEDVAVAFGTLVPLYQTKTMEFKTMNKEAGLAYFGDGKVLQPKYLQRIKLNNLVL